MRFPIRSTALGLALTAAASAAHAQTVITRAVVDPAVMPAPVMQETIRTTTTRVVRPALRIRPHIVTTHTVTRRIIPGPAVVARTVAPHPLYDTVAPAPLYDTVAPRPLYDTVAPAPVVTTSDDDYAPGLYDEVATVPPLAPAPVVAAPIVQAPVIYRYVYEPGRILVIDPATGIAIQAIPR